MVVKLKTIRQMKSMCDEFEGQLQLDSVGFNEDRFTNLPRELELLKFEEHDMGICIMAKHAGNTVYLASGWVKSIDGFDLLPEFVLANNYIKLAGGNMLQVHTKTIVHSSTLPVCSDCGTPTTNIVCGIKICDACLAKKTKLNSYNFKPEPYFVGEQLVKDEANPYYYGIELEYGLKGKKEMGELMMEFGDKVYLKADSSIHGGDFKAELVSHPHSYKEIMSGSSFIEKLSTLKHEEQRQYNGCHIHISRTAFVDDKHYAKWYFLMHEMRRINEFVGGRELTTYCEFIPSGKIYKKKKGDKGNQGTRSVMINESNDATVECRFFSSTSNANEVKMFVQYLESLIKFTKYCDDVVSISKWLEYVKRKEVKYAILVKKLAKYNGSFEGHVEYRQAKLGKGNASSITLDNIDNIDTIKCNGRVYTDLSDIRVENGMIRLNFDNNRDSTRWRLNQIEEITWEY